MKFITMEVIRFIRKAAVPGSKAVVIDRPHDDRQAAVERSAFRAEAMAGSDASSQSKRPLSARI